MKNEQIVEACLVKMFQMNGINIRSISGIKKWVNNCDNPKVWYQAKPWTQEQDDEFRKWMYKFVKSKTRWSKAKVDKEVMWFSVMWGWTAK